MTTTTTERFNALDAHIADGRLIRNSWASTDKDGRALACLLVALAPEAAGGDASACPASVIPAWLAHLTPLIDDCVSQREWPTVIREYARFVRAGAVSLDNAGWRRVQARFMICVLAEAPSEPGVAVAALWTRVMAGDEPSAEDWSAAEAATEWAAGAWAGAWLTARAATWTAATATAAAATEAAGAVALAAARSVREQESTEPWEAAEAAMWNEKASWDRMAAALFAAIDLEVAP